MVDGGLRPGSERTASNHGVKQMVAVPRRWGQRVFSLAKPAGRFLKQSLSRVMGCLVVCEGGDLSVGGCQGLPNERVVVPTDEEMYGKNV